MDWTVSITNVTDDLPNSDLLTVSANFTNGTDSFDKSYKVSAAEYAEEGKLQLMLSQELTRFVGIKDIANTFRKVAITPDALPTVQTKVDEVVLEQKAETTKIEVQDGAAEPETPPEV